MGKLFRPFLWPPGVGHPLPSLPKRDAPKATLWPRRIAALMRTAPSLAEVPPRRSRPARKLADTSWRLTGRRSSHMQMQIRRLKRPTPPSDRLLRPMRREPIGGKSVSGQAAAGRPRPSPAALGHLRLRTTLAPYLAPTPSWRRKCGRRRPTLAAAQDVALRPS